MKKHFDKFCEWQISHCERMRKLLNLSHCQHLWISFAKGILVGILLCMIAGCSANPKVANKEAPPTPKYKGKSFTILAALVIFLSRKPVS